MLRSFQAAEWRQRRRAGLYERRQNIGIRRRLKVSATASAWRRRSEAWRRS
jgi:hypothetical protein